MNKFVCPNCGGKLYIRFEHVYDKCQDIDVNTGKLHKRVFRVYTGDCSTLVGIQCKDCTFEYLEEDEGHPEFRKIIENANYNTSKIYDDDTKWFKK